MSASPPASEEELHAFLDGELPADRRRQIDLQLCDDPALAARLAAYAADRDRLRAVLGEAAGNPVPAAWIGLIEARTATPPRVAGRRFAIAAGVALVVGGGTIAAIERLAPRGILAVAQDARFGRLRIVHALPIEALAEIASRDDALQATLGFKARAPALGRFGFELAGLETYRHAAQLRYVDRNGRLLTIYVRPSDGHVRFDLLRQGKVRVCIWQDNVVGAVIMAPMDAEEMTRIAVAAYGDLNL